MIRSPHIPFLALIFSITAGVILGKNLESEIVNTATQIIIAGAAVFALKQISLSKEDYDVRKETRRIDLTLSQIKLFKEISDEIGQYSILLQEKCISLNPIQSFNINISKKDIKKNEKLLENIARFELIREDESQNKILYTTAVEILNSIEEFSLSLRLTDNYNNEALNVIKKSFFEIIEMFSIPFLTFHHVRNFSFHNLIFLWNAWKNEYNDIDAYDAELGPMVYQQYLKLKILTEDI